MQKGRKTVMVQSHPVESTGMVYVFQLWGHPTDRTGVYSFRLLRCTDSCSQLLSFAAAHIINMVMFGCMRKWIIMSIHTEEFSTDISFKMVPAGQHGHLGMQVRRGFADWTQCSDPQHQPVSFICFISIVRSTARSFNSQELTKSLLRHLFKDDSPKNMRVKNIKWSRRFL